MGLGSQGHFHRRKRMGFFDFFWRKKKSSSSVDTPAGLIDGGSTETAIVIQGVPSHSAGIRAEYEYLEQKYGIRGVDWKLAHQALLNKDERMYDRICIRLSDGTERIVYFNIDDFFGR
jgi:hypothetical protein